MPPPQKLDYALPTPPPRPPIAWYWFALAAMWALPCLLLGLAWTYTFAFTSYRSHLAYIGLPLGIALTLLGLALLRCPVWIANLLRNTTKRQ